MGKINVRYTHEYPYNKNYKYTAKLKIINLDKERKHDIFNNNGFFIKESQSIKKDLKSVDGILSSKFGDMNGDPNPFANRYSCDCGKLTHRINQGMICDNCHTPVQYRDDNFKITGWICLTEEYIIHPNLYKSIAFFIGVKKFESILKPDDNINEDGFIIKEENTKDNPYVNIGITEFHKRFKEIMDYYLSKNPIKKDNYDHIMENKDKVFIQSIPVYTSLLRPVRVDGENLIFESTNAIYNMMAKLVPSINRNNLKLFRKTKSKKLLIWELQEKYNELYTEIENILAQKKGIVRNLFGGRYNFTSRAIIVPDPKLRIDTIKLPYAALVEVLQQTIVNILHKSYNITYSEAWDIWYLSQLEVNPRVVQIIQSIIENQDNGRGIPFIVNRNPSITYGSLQQMYCVGINFNYTMSVPIQPLPKWNADFDGDCLNIWYLINKEFVHRCELVFNPRNSMYISKNDGLFDNDVNHCRDTLINANSLNNLADEYTDDQLAKIRYLKEHCK